MLVLSLLSFQSAGLTTFLFSALSEVPLTLLRDPLMEMMKNS
jgi:hypothetical protein